MVIGNIWHGRFFNDADVSYYTTVDMLEECTHCDYLPVCMGGCADYRVRGCTRFDCNAFKKLMVKQKLVEGGAIQ